MVSFNHSVEARPLHGEEVPASSYIYSHFQTQARIASIVVEANYCTGVILVWKQDQPRFWIWI